MNAANTAPSAAGGGMPSWIAPLAITMVMQTMAAFLMRVLPVIGPELTAAAGLSPEKIGILAGLVAGGTMWFLVGGSLLLTYFGPVRLLQLGALVGSLSVLLSTTAYWPLLAVASIAIGVGYGPSPPAGSEILTRNAPKGRRSLIMSIKQSGVPLGGALAGLLLPPIAAAAGWRVALATAAALSLVAALLVQPWRARLDADRDPSRPPTLANLFAPANLKAPFVVLFDIPGMLPVTFAGFCFACVQGCLLTFFVTQLTTEVGYTLAVAGAAFSAMQFAGTFARVVMGWLADKLGGMRALVVLSLTSSLMVLVVSRIGLGWPVWAVTLVGLIVGMTSTSWNGVYLAEVARLAPPGRVGDATSGSTFFTFSGYLFSPIVFALVVPMVGSYGTCFVALAAIAILAAPVLWPHARAAHAAER
ncbi:MAG: MFS transporter [Alphaproteobacteria bacterium]|nr:MFS transporter [Alphaproteobacteria bacterium]